MSLASFGTVFEEGGDIASHKSGYATTLLDTHLPLFKEDAAWISPSNPPSRLRLRPSRHLASTRVYKHRSVQSVASPKPLPPLPEDDDIRSDVHLQGIDDSISLPASVPKFRSLNSSRPGFSSPHLRPVSSAPSFVPSPPSSAIETDHSPILSPVPSFLTSPPSSIIDMDRSQGPSPAPSFVPSPPNSVLDLDLSPVPSAPVPLSPARPYTWPGAPVNDTSDGCIPFIKKNQFISPLASQEIQSRYSGLPSEVYSKHAGRSLPDPLEQSSASRRFKTVSL